VKTQIIYSLLFVAFFAAACKAGATSGLLIEKKKVITDSYPLTEKSVVKIVNTYGNVNVYDWDKNEVKVEVTITVKSENEKLAQAMLDEITINESNRDPILFETKIGSNKNNNKKTNFIINYKVYLPQRAKLTVKNSFGDINIEDRNGLTNLNASFGDINLGNLVNLESLKIEFGNVVAKKVNVKKLNANYTDVDIKSLEGNVESSFDYGDTKIGVSNALESLKVKISYADFTLEIPENLDATFDIKTSFAELTNHSSVSINDLSVKDKYGTNFTKKYNGKSRNGKALISINASYGEVKLRDK
jgi:hypothetical protein